MDCFSDARSPSLELPDVSSVTGLAGPQALAAAVRGFYYGMSGSGNSQSMSKPIASAQE
jgi:hypothetical protein